MIDLCVSSLFSNEIVGSFFSFMKVVKNVWCEALLGIKVEGSKIGEFIKNIQVIQRCFNGMQRNEEKEGMGNRKVLERLNSLG